MKQFCTQLLMALCMATFFIACKKDGDSANPKDESGLEIGGDKYDMKYGYFLDYGFDAEEYNVELYITGEKVESMIDESCKDCHVLFLDLYYPGGSLGVGQFEIYGDIGVPNAFAYFTGDNLDEESGIEITKGTVDISGQFPNLTVVLDGTDENGEKVKATFTGEFADLDELTGDENSRKRMDRPVRNLKIKARK